MPRIADFRDSHSTGSHRLASFSKSLFYVFDDHPARLCRSELRIVYYFRAEGDHERRNSALTITLIAGSEIFFDAFRRATTRTFFQLRIEIILEICFREYI